MHTFLSKMFYLATILLILALLIQHLYGQNMYNWGGTFTYSTRNIEWPRSVAQVRSIVKNANKVRCVAQRHSFSRIADSNDTLVDTIGLKNIITPMLPVPLLPTGGPVVGINPLNPTVWVQAGLTYADLGPFLDYARYALRNLASLGDVSIAGATQTGVHGSGNTLGCLSTQIRAMRLVRADGTLALIPRGDPRLDALATGLGAFGVITELELELVPTYSVITNVFLNLPHEEFMLYFDNIMAAGYSVSVYADFLLPRIWNQVWVTERTDDNQGVGKQQFLLNTKAERTTVQQSPMILLPSSYISKQGVELPWYFGLVVYQLGLLSPGEYRNSISGFTSREDEIQTEYFVAHENATAAIDAIYTKYSTLLAPLLWYALIRTVKCDQLWLSMCRCRGPGDDYAVAIDLTFKPSFTLVDPVLKQVEAELIRFGARPHWGKYFLMGPEQFLHTYDKLDEFVALAKQFDPNGKFRNEFLDKNVFVNNGK